MNDFVALLMYLEGSQAVRQDVRLNELMDKAQKHVETIEAENEGLRELAQETADKPTHIQGWMRAHDIVVDDLDDKWQVAFFSVYTDLVEVAEKCRQFLEEPADE